MFSHNPNATPIWLLIIFSAVSCFGTPQIKKYVSKHVTDEEKQNFYTSILWVVLLVIVVTLSVIFVP